MKSIHGEKCELLRGSHRYWILSLFLIYKCYNNPLDESIQFLRFLVYRGWGIYIAKLGGGGCLAVYSKVYTLFYHPPVAR